MLLDFVADRCPVNGVNASQSARIPPELVIACIRVDDGETFICLEKFASAFWKVWGFRLRRHKSEQHREYPK